MVDDLDNDGELSGGWAVLQKDNASNFNESGEANRHDRKVLGGVMVISEKLECQAKKKPIHARSAVRFPCLKITVV